jgi:hypothetical protein
MLLTPLLPLLPILAGNLPPPQLQQRMYQSQCHLLSLLVLPPSQLPTSCLRQRCLTCQFARSEAVAADVSIATAAAYSTLGVTIAATAEAAAVEVTVATAASANLATAEAAVADVPVPVATAASYSASSAAVDFAAVAVVVPVVASVENKGVSFK